jgi:hypothetical protein
MSAFQRHYPDWKAPAEDGRTVLWPEPAPLLADVRSNQRRLAAAANVHIQGVALPELRRRMRGFVGHDDSQPLIVTGHQVELHHPGVWVKNILINDIAARTDGRALHVALDTDSPKHLTLRWPGEALPISDDSRLTSAAWSGLLDPPTPAHLDDIRRKLADASAGWSFQPLLGEMINSLRRLSLESMNLPTALTNAMHELDWKLGLQHHIVLSSPIWAAEPYLLFAHDLLSNIEALARRYNAALADYRAAHGIRSKMRPMPDLFITDESIETPFWLDNLATSGRTRPTLFRTDGGWMLTLSDGRQFTFDPKADGWDAAQRLGRWLTETQHRLPPRALTQMLFLRLALADHFVHGIGGGRYDQVTDRLIADHYGIEPPMFAVTTATMYFPDAVGRQRVCMPCVKQEGHRVRHGLLGERKRDMVAEIAALPRRSPQRSQRYFQMHRQLAAAAADSDAIRRWQTKFEDSLERDKEEQTLFDRELFYALQPQSRLADMIAAYRQLFG